MRQGQREGVGQRESRDSLTIPRRPDDAFAIEVEDLEAHGAEAIAAVGFQLVPVQQIGDAEFEAQSEGCGEEGATFKIDEHGRIRYDDSVAHSSGRGWRRRQGAAHVVVDLGDADVQKLGRFRLADGAFGEGAQTEPVEPVRRLAGHGAVLLVGR